MSYLSWWCSKRDAERMSWSIGFDSKWSRDIGYGVTARCDHPNCNKVIDRGLAHVCGGEPYGGDNGCGLYFCGLHHYGENSLCAKCHNRLDPFKPKLDHPDWIRHKFIDPSWQEWRDQNVEWVKATSASLKRGENLPEPKVN